MHPHDPAVVPFLRDMARQELLPLRHSCIGLDVEDLVAAGWLEYHRAWHRAQTVRTREAYAGQSARFGMRRALRNWIGGRRSVRLVQVERFEALALPDDTYVSRVPGLRRRARRLLARIRPRRRNILAAIYGDGMSPALAAQVLGESPAFVHKARYQAVQQLAQWAVASC